MILAIDPGKSGALVTGRTLDDPHTFNMPDTLGDLVQLFRRIVHVTDCVVYLEKVGGYAGGRGAPGSAMFNFGQNYGHLEAIAHTLGLEVRHVTPQKWQKALALGTSNGRSKTEWKNHLKAKAQMLYPNHKVTLANADALLIFHAAKRGLI
jgi:hypothetical protein